MAIKDIYISDVEFLAQVCSTETGIIRYMVKDFVSRIYPIQGSTIENPNRLFLPYEFKHSYSAMMVDFEEMCLSVMQKYRKWYDNNKNIITEDTELPIFTANNSFKDFYDSRLLTFLRSSVDPKSQWYLDHKNDMCIINADHNKIYIYNSDTKIILDDDGRIHILNSDMTIPELLGECEVLAVDVMEDDTDEDIYSKITDLIEDDIKVNNPVIDIFEEINY